MKKLHLGCGNKYLNGWINVDIEAKCADIKMDIKDLSFNDNSIDEIYICHVLEHIKKNELINILNKFNNILKPNGILRISVPDFEKVVCLYNKYHDISLITGLVNGGQKNEYDIHYNIFDFKILSKILEETGFYNITNYNSEEFLKDYDDYSKAYIPHMDKNGINISLNLVCIKKNHKISNNENINNEIKHFLRIK